MLMYTLKLQTNEGERFQYAEEIDAVDDSIAILLAQDSITALSRTFHWELAVLCDEDGETSWESRSEARQ
jgi:hypothetical protein